MILVTVKATGQRVEVLDVASGGFVFAAPPGKPEAGKIYHRSELDPDPIHEVTRVGLVPWHDR